MKVEQKKEFQPVTITLESKWEAKSLNNLLSKWLSDNYANKLPDTNDRDLFASIAGELSRCLNG